MILPSLMGFGKTRRQIKDIAKAVARNKGILKEKSRTDGFDVFLNGNLLFLCERVTPQLLQYVSNR